MVPSLLDGTLKVEFILYFEVRIVALGSIQIYADHECTIKEIHTGECRLFSRTQSIQIGIQVNPLKFI